MHALLAIVRVTSSRSKSLLQEIDDDCSKLLCQSWEATLRFKVYQCEESEFVDTLSVYFEVDLFSLTSNILGGGQIITQFDPTQYPLVPGTMKDKKASVDKLCTDLMKVTKKGNCPLVNCGSYGKTKQCISLVGVLP